MKKLELFADEKIQLSKAATKKVKGGRSLPIPPVGNDYDAP